MKKLYFNFRFVNIYCLGLLVIVAFLLGTLNSNGQVRVPFSQRTSKYTPTKNIYSIKGDFTIIGNTNLTLQNYNDDRDNSNNMVRVDRDGIGSTRNSSSATLAFPTSDGGVTVDPTCSNIIYAGLYWTGRTDSDVDDNVKRAIKIKAPGQSAYQQLTASTSDIRYPGDNNMYVGYYEITDLVKQYKAGEYWVADMALSTGDGGNTGYYGGWSMIVVYENSKMKMRDVTIFDGYAYVEGNTTVHFPLAVSGFNTPEGGLVNMKLGLVAGEGDRGVDGDYFAIKNPTTEQFDKLANGMTANTSNFFDSSIPANTRTPNLVNNTGMDIHMFNIPNQDGSVNKYIGNSQTSTTFEYGSTQDTYNIFCIAMAVDAYRPEPVAVSSFSPSSPNTVTVLPDGQIQYKVEIYNKGSEAVNNTVVKIPIPFNATYVSHNDPILINTSPLLTNDIEIDEAGNKTIVWNLGTLPVTNSKIAELTYTIKATNECSILVVPCAAYINLNGIISGIGAVNGVSTGDIQFIRGYNTGSCSDVPLYGSLLTTINVSSSLFSPGGRCAGVAQIQNFTNCVPNAGVPVSVLRPFFPVGSRFYNTPDDTGTEYTDTNNFPYSTATVTYYAIPPNQIGETTACTFQFTIKGGGAAPGNPTVTPQTFCAKSGEQSFIATAIAGCTLLWYDTQTGGSATTETPKVNTNTETGIITKWVSQKYPNSIGCESSRVAVTITVNPLPTVVAGSYGPVCVDAADVTLTGSPAGGTWSGIGVTGNKFDPSVGTQELTYTYTNANGCTNFDKTTITVNPLPTVVAGSYGPVCVDAADVTLTGSPAGGTWSGIGVYRQQV